MGRLNISGKDSREFNFSTMQKVGLISSLDKVLQAIYMEIYAYPSNSAKVGDQGV
jgi:hypothetical protein